MNKREFVKDRQSLEKLAPVARANRLFISSPLEVNKHKNTQQSDWFNLEQIQGESMAGIRGRNRVFPIYSIKKCSGKNAGHSKYKPG
ncbi:MAG: hypothetical protein ACR2LT_09990 [Pyrinomonadaceae bacterium]